jgi:hypothetical protein
MISAGVGGWIAGGVSVFGVWARTISDGVENNIVNIVAAMRKKFKVRNTT